MRLAITKSSSLVKGLSTRALARSKPPTIAVEEEPNPREGGIIVSEVI